MTERKASVAIHEAWCKGCRICLEICPKHVFDEEETKTAKGYPKIRVSRPQDCSLCMLCENSCPDLAITVEEAMRVPAADEEKEP